jgi:hypothetical protein
VSRATAKELRRQASRLRTSSTPLSELIPLLQRAADELDEVTPPIELGNKQPPAGCIEVTELHNTRRIYEHTTTGRRYIGAALTR